jgi:dienelactone hydrolase
MGIIIIMIALVIEVAFIAYAIRKEDNQDRLRSQVRIGAFILFIVFTLTSVIEWSFRWYLLDLLLAILALIGVGRLVTNKFGKKSFRRNRALTKGVAMWVLVTIAALPAVIFPQFRTPVMTGALEVAKASYTFRDMSRVETFTDNGENRKVNVDFWYPEDAHGKYPLIVFSHGAFGVRMSNASTFTELASNGYVVASIDHPYHAAGTIDTEGNLTIGSNAFMQEVIDANSDVYTEKEQFDLYTKWMDLRTGDMNFVIDTIFQNVRDSKDDVYGRIDTDRLGLIGHSLGGAASAQLGRERDDVDAVIDLDGTMLGEYTLNSVGGPAMTEEPYPLPLLNFYSEYVLRELEADPDYVYPNRFITSISPQAFEVSIKGTNHMSYTDLPLFSPFLASQLSGMSGGASKATVDKYYSIETMNALVLDFFDTYVKGEGMFTTKGTY